MMNRVRCSIQLKGTLTAIIILVISCTGSFLLMVLLYLAFIKTSNISLQMAHRLSLVPLISSLLIGSGLLFYALKRITNPIRAISAAASEVAKGNFTVKVDYQSSDEIGRLAESFNLMTAELSSMEYLRKDFMSNVSHEFKTPIASIQGFVEMLQDKSLTEEQFDQYTKIIAEETRRLSQLSTNMLRLSRLDNQYIPEKRNRFQLDEQIRRTILLLEEKWSEKNLSLDLDLPEIEFVGEEALVQQIWLNLIGNAIKYSHFDGEIAITANCLTDEVMVTIKDNGIGISSTESKRIFEKFYQADQSHSKEGSGLGLAIVKRIVDICSGSISVESKEGEGTTFIVKMPIQGE